MLPTKKTVVGASMLRGLDLKEAYVGMQVDVPFQLTLSEGYRDLWQGCFFTLDRLYTSTPFAESMKFDEQILPFGLILNDAVSMSHVDATREVLEVGFENAVYLKPVYAGDTLTKSFVIKNLRPTQDAKHSIIVVECQLYNQNDEMVFSADKLLLFYQLTHPSRILRQPHNASPPPKSAFLEHLKQNGQDFLPANSPLAVLQPGQLILHDATKPIGKSMNMMLSTLFRNMHPMLHNYKRYKENEIVVPGALVASAACAASARALFEVLYESMEWCNFINKVAPLDAIGAMTYVRSIRQLTEGLEELQVTTVGMKNVDVTRDLKGVELPIELFTEQLMPSSLEELIGSQSPVLKDKIVCVVSRTLVRQSPYGQMSNVPLL